jgi:hypothetical protein
MDIDSVYFTEEEESPNINWSLLERNAKYKMDKMDIKWRDDVITEHHRIQTAIMADKDAIQRADSISAASIAAQHMVNETRDAVDSSTKTVRTTKRYINRIKKAVSIARKKVKDAEEAVDIEEKKVEIMYENAIYISCKTRKYRSMALFKLDNAVIIANDNYDKIYKKYKEALTHYNEVITEHKTNIRRFIEANNELTILNDKLRKALIHMDATMLEVREAKRIFRKRKWCD